MPALCRQAHQCDRQLFIDSSAWRSSLTQLCARKRTVLTHDCKPGLAERSFALVISDHVALFFVCFVSGDLVNSSASFADRLLTQLASDFWFDTLVAKPRMLHAYLF
jgi:hypothetical protein